MAKTKAKSTSVKKSIKSNKNKKFSLKNLDIKKNWKKLSYLGLAGFLMLSTFGYAAWKEVELQNAKAAGLMYKNGTQCIARIATGSFAGTRYFSAISPSSGRALHIQAINGGWYSVGYWTSPNIVSGGSYNVLSSSLKSRGITGNVTLKATLTLNSGATITDSCFTYIQ